LEEMKGVRNRATFVRLAAATANRDIAFFRQRQAMMYAGYHKSVAPIETFLALGEFAAARTSTNEVVFNVPLDHLVWTQDIAKLLTAADAKVVQLTRPTNKQLWITGTVSTRTKKELDARGWQVHERTEERLFSWAEEYPKYEKPDEKSPAGLVKLHFKSVGVGIGGSSGDGVLSYQGKDYPLAISGLNVGDLGVSQFQGAGKVYDLKSIADFSGNYVATQAGFAVRGGQSSLSMRNAKGVTVVILQDQGKESGTRLSLGPSGVTLKIK
jgi:hypothetical protein